MRGRYLFSIIRRNRYIAFLLTRCSVCPILTAMSDKLINLDSLLSLLSAEVSSVGGQKQFANSAGVSQAYVADILAGKRSPGPKILRALGFEKVILYRYAHADKAASLVGALRIK